MAIRKPKLVENFDKVLDYCIITLILIGLVYIYSATLDVPEHTGVISWIKAHPTFLKQIIWTVLAYLLYLVVRHSKIPDTRNSYGVIALVAFLVLLAVLFLGHTSMGATRWLNLGFIQLQPSEFAKIVYVLLLAGLIAKLPEDFNIYDLLKIGFTMAMFVIPIFLQPDLTTGMVFVVLTFVVVFGMGHKLRWINLAFSIIFALILIAWFTPGDLLIKEYQRNRVLSLFKPQEGHQDDNYQRVQAITAIGSGGLWGKGLLQGSQTQMKNIPMSKNDFIFSVAAEEGGFFLALFILIVFGLMLSRCYLIAMTTTDRYEQAIAFGLASMLTIHFVINIGMNLGITPVAGVPLPLVSAGGSNLLTVFLTLGMLQSIKSSNTR